jgi:two-component system sensor histidine kinase ResE
MQVVDLREVVEEAVRAMQPLVTEGGRLEASVPPQQVPVLGDKMRLEIILANLIDNAIKYSPEQPHIRCALSAVDGHAEVMVTDSGFGIDSADLPLLFTRFGRVVTEQTSHIAGTGLGLYVSRQLARLHNGDIAVISKRGSGSTFTVTLPLASNRHEN